MRLNSLSPSGGERPHSLELAHQIPGNLRHLFRIPVLSHCHIKQPPQTLGPWMLLVLYLNFLLAKQKQLLILQRTPHRKKMWVIASSLLMIKGRNQLCASNS